MAIICHRQKPIPQRDFMKLGIGDGGLKIYYI
jgi:hypothetical protein